MIMIINTMQLMYVCSMDKLGLFIYFLKSKRRECVFSALILVSLFTFKNSMRLGTLHLVLLCIQKRQLPPRDVLPWEKPRCDVKVSSCELLGQS